MGDNNVIERKAFIFNKQKYNMYDGPGVRTLVFFKGCPLRCKWCSTPESQRMEIEKRYGKDMTVEEVVKEICKDEIFFFHSGEVLKDVEIPDMEMLKKMAEVIRAEDPEAAVKVKGE